MRRRTPGPLKTYLQVDTGLYATFDQLRDAIRMSLRARKGLSSMSAGGKAKVSDEDAMDVDALYGTGAKQGKGKGKGGKGQDT